MKTLTDLLSAVPPNVLWITGLILGLCILLVGFLAGRKAYRALRSRSLEDVLTVVAAGIATAVSASGMWQFFERIMPDVPWYWRVAMFAFIEVAVINSAVRAKRSMKEKFSAGVDGVAVWALTCLSAALSAMEAASLPEALFRLAAPLVAAWLWERGMAIERHRITGLAGINWRITPERFLVRVGLAEARDRTASEVDVQRRLTRVALAADNVAEAKPGSWRHRHHIARLKKRGRQMVEHTAVAQDPAQQALLMAQLGVARSITALAEDAPTPFWKTAENEPSDFARLADETERLRDGLATTAELRAIEANVLMVVANATGRSLESVTSGVTPAVTHAEVTGQVTKEVTDPPFFAPHEWLDEAADVTSGVTDFVTVERVTDQVTDKVTFDVTDRALFDLRWPPLELADVTPAVTPGVTADEVTDKVTEEVTATAVMRAHWDANVAKDVYPSPTELAEVGGLRSHSHPSRLRKEWVAELPWRQRLKANAKPKKTVAVNGSK